MSPFETYQKYLSMKSHFTNSKYDFFKYGGKSRATVTSFNKRKDKYFFEKLSRQKQDKEIIDYFLSNFIATDYPGNLWIGEIIRSGEDNYQEWKKRQQSLSYIFKEQSQEMLSEANLNEVLDASKQHPPILKMFLGGKICIETLVIWDKIFLFGNNFDKKLLDPVWEIVSLKVKKYSPFINIDMVQFKKILKNIINE
jgi:hypothetical protein